MSEFTAGDQILTYLFREYNKQMEVL